VPDPPANIIPFILPHYQTMNASYCIMKKEESVA
jgi:hypothetical protein